jgi:hypothetical protein
MLLALCLQRSKKSGGYPVDNPILSVRRPKRAEPSDRRFTDDELNLFFRGNHTTPEPRSIIRIAYIYRQKDMNAP